MLKINGTDCAENDRSNFKISLFHLNKSVKFTADNNCRFTIPIYVLFDRRQEPVCPSLPTY